jgi:hypothetical protein
VQTLDLVNSLPKYRDNIHAKSVAIQQGPPGPLSLAFRNVGELIGDLAKVTEPVGGAEQSKPIKVQIVSGAESAMTIVRNSMSPLAGSVAAFAVVVVLLR